MTGKATRLYSTDAQPETKRTRVSGAQSTTKQETNADVETEAPNADFEVNPFGLQTKANG